LGDGGFRFEIHDDVVAFFMPGKLVSEFSFLPFARICNRAALFLDDRFEPLGQLFEVPVRHIRADDVHGFVLAIIHNLIPMVFEGSGSAPEQGTPWRLSSEDTLSGTQADSGEDEVLAKVPGYFGSGFEPVKCAVQLNEPLFFGGLNGRTRMLSVNHFMRRAVLMAAVLLSGIAEAFDITGGTGMGNIPDGTDVNNSPGAPLVISLNVFGTNEIVTSLTIAGAIGLTHTWYGDLTVVLAHNGISVDLMDRNYRSSTLDQGNDGELDGNYMFSEPASSTNGSLSGSGFAPPGTYARWHNPIAGSSEASGSYDGFVGMPLDGLWTLTFTDYAQSDTGQVLGGMRITGTGAPVPEIPVLSALLTGVVLLRPRIVKRSKDKSASLTN